MNKVLHLGFKKPTKDNFHIMATFNENLPIISESPIPLNKYIVSIFNIDKFKHKKSILTLEEIKDKFNIISYEEGNI